MKTLVLWQRICSLFPREWGSLRDVKQRSRLIVLNFREMILVAHWRKFWRWQDQHRQCFNSARAPELNLGERGENSSSSVGPRARSIRSWQTGVGGDQDVGQEEVTEGEWIRGGVSVYGREAGCWQKQMKDPAQGMMAGGCGLHYGLCSGWSRGVTVETLNNGELGSEEVGCRVGAGW